MPRTWSMTETITGTNRSAGVSQTELLDQDTHPVAPALREESREGLAEGNTRVPAWYYTSREFHDLEVEKLWSRVWQLACLEEEIPNVGDYHVYEIADRSFLIMRTEEGPAGIKAFRNACLHRGRLLRETHGKEARNLRCAFHGWAWNLDGSMKEVPCEWDFPSLRKEDYSLPEAKVDTWDGFVFINPDRDSAPLADYLEGLDVHFEKYPFARKVKVAHVEKIMRCNWKACQEAFMEAYHVVATHPTLMESLGDANTRYDTWGNFSRAISPQQIDSPHLADMPKFEIDPDGKQYARFRHPLNGHIYERVDMSSPLSNSQVRIIDIDGHESLFEVDGTHISGPITQADPTCWSGSAARRRSACSTFRWRTSQTPTPRSKHVRSPQRCAAPTGSSGPEATSTPRTSRTPTWSTRSGTRCSRTGHRGARSTHSSTDSARTATTPIPASSK